MTPLKLSKEELDVLLKALQIAAGWYEDEAMKWKRTRATAILTGADIARCRRVMTESRDLVSELMHLFRNAHQITVTIRRDGGCEGGES